MAGVLITGAAQRLGKATAKLFHSKGYCVHLHCQQSVEAANELALKFNQIRSNSAFVYQADLMDLEQITLLCKSVIAQEKNLKVLVNNASAFFPTSISHSEQSEQWRLLMGVNLQAPYFLIQNLKAQLSQNTGCVVNMVDIHGIRPLEDHSIYSISKAGLIALTKSLALELAPDIRVNAVAPGAIIWPEDSDLQYQQRISSQIPLQKNGQETDISDAIWFLIQADYITGQILPIDGGRTLKQ